MSTDVDQRLTELEIKASFTEDLVDKLDLIITRQQATIDSLLRQVRELAERVDKAPGTGRTSLLDELPPHY